jgi:hypothetical protein
LQVRISLFSQGVCLSSAPSATLREKIRIMESGEWLGLPRAAVEKKQEFPPQSDVDNKI